MRICYLTEEYPPETGRGGIGTYAHEIACAMADLGHEVHVITKTGGAPYQVEHEGIMVHRIPRPAIDGVGQSYRVAELIGRSLAVYTKVSELDATRAFDIIEAPEIGSEALHLAFKSEICLVTRLHTPTFLVKELNPHQGDTVFPYATPFPETADVLERHQTVGSAGITAISRAIALRVGKRWGIDLDRIEVIPNSFDPNIASTEDPTVYEATLAEAEYLLYYGRLEERKGVHVFASALPSILREFPRIKAAFVGEDMGYRNRSMRSWVLDQTRDFLDRLVFIDRLEHAALFPIIRNAKLMVLPAPWEGLGYTCLESLALGKVVVATFGSGFEEMIRHGENGFLTGPGDSEGLANIVKELLLREDLDSIGRKAEARSLDFRAVRIGRRMADYYERLASEPRKRLPAVV